MTSQTVSANGATSPTELRTIFGANLRRLSADYPSVSSLCRELGINRTQFNRYLSGESFPRPDVLHRICTFFGTDARILLEPYEALQPVGERLLNHPEISAFLGDYATKFDSALLPSGLYRFSRRSFIDAARAVMGIALIYRRDGYTFMRGYEAPSALAHQGVSASPASREFRGLCLSLEDGIAILVSRRNAVTCTFNFLTRVAAFDQSFWDGYAARTIREAIGGQRANRMVYEYLGQLSNPVARSRIFDTARNGGLIETDSLPPYHQRLLRLHHPFR